MRSVTGWELCEMVAKKLKDEPQHYCQLAWTISPANREAYGMDTPDRCGTAYCIGGWMRYMLGVPTIKDVATVLEVHYGSTLINLFEATALENYLPEFGKGPNPGTPAYAKLGIAHLRQWMGANKDHLKSVKVMVHF